VMYYLYVAVTLGGQCTILGSTSLQGQTLYK